MRREFVGVVFKDWRSHFLLWLRSVAKPFVFIEGQSHSWKIKIVENNTSINLTGRTYCDRKQMMLMKVLNRLSIHPLVIFTVGDFF